MALVKKTAMSEPKDLGDTIADPPARSKPRPSKTGRRSPAKSTAADRIAAASLELASGIGQAASAAAQLQHAMDQISRGAEEAASAAQQSSGSIGSLVRDFGDAKQQAVASLGRAEKLRSGFIDTQGQVETSVASIEINADRQLSSVKVIQALETKAADITSISSEVSDVSEQTGLLALNAALEASRAGDHGRGFSIVADEVRMLAETSDTRSREIRDLAQDIQTIVRTIAEKTRASAETARREANTGRALTTRIAQAQEDLAVLNEGADAIVQVATEANVAAGEAAKGAEQVASAAEEQAAAAAEARQAVQQQTQSLDQSHQAAEQIATITEGSLSGVSSETSEQISAAAEELSAMVQELSGSATQILLAIDQIGKGTEIQSSATLQADTAMTQIETLAAAVLHRATYASERITALQVMVGESREVVGTLVNGVDSGLLESRAIADRLVGLVDTTRRIERIIDGLSLVAVQITMLAVSGSVEATRAGDAGAGFATVALDIRTLARSAADNADSAKGIVRGMQDEVSDFRRDLDLISAAADVEIARNHGVIASLDAMISELAALQTGNELIVQGAQNIVTAASQVRIGTEQIASVAQEAAAAVHQAAAAARQQAQGAEDLAAAIEEIASLSAVLIPARA